MDNLELILILWLLLCVIVGGVANSVGRKFSTYFVISIFLSPLIGFIVLAIKGKKTPDEIFEETPHIFYCSL